MCLFSGNAFESMSFGTKIKRTCSRFNLMYGACYNIFLCKYGNHPIIHDFKKLIRYLQILATSIEGRGSIIISYSDRNQI